MSFTLFKIGGSRRKKTLSTIVRFPYSLRTSSYYYANYYVSLPRSREIADLLPTVARNENEMESSLNTECQRKETLNMVSGRASNARKTYKA